MNKIKQNKINFTLILSALAILFSSLTILSLPVLFNYESKVTVIEKNFYKNFKFYLNTSGNISYKPFPKPHLLVENASLSLPGTQKNNKLINTKKLKIFISLRDIYLRTFDNFRSTKISNSNLEINTSEIIDLRSHLYNKINKPIIFENCKIFLKNKDQEVILISPVKKIIYKINKKTKSKNFNINGEIFGLKFKSEWKRDYNKPKNSFHNINIVYPKIEIKNIFKFENKKNFEGNTQIFYERDKLEYNVIFKDDQIEISSPNKENINYYINSKIQLTPFYFEGETKIKEKKIENIIDFLLNLLSYEKNYIGNLNGILKIKFSKINNKLIKNGEIELIINEKKIDIKNSNFNLDKIGKIETDISFSDEQGVYKFKSKNKLNIKDHIEFAKIFQISSKKVKNINKIFFDLEKNFGETDFIIKNIKINDETKNDNLDEMFIITNLQKFRAQIRKIIN